MQLHITLFTKPIKYLLECEIVCTVPGEERVDIQYIIATHLPLIAHARHYFSAEATTGLGAARVGFSLAS